MTKLSKVVLDKKVLSKKANTEKKIDKRTSNPGRPVNRTSARQLRLAQQSYYETLNAKFHNGNPFKLSADSAVEFHYTPNADGKGGCLFNGIGSHECNIDYIGRTKVTGYTFVLNKLPSVSPLRSAFGVYLNSTAELLFNLNGLPLTNLAFNVS